ncbi:MAG: peptidylprolyl isomerase [Gammaproteobacteria bacterium]|nr:MAG: peptidylprolyl isomerase [Gammaproteobacteria bacterium]
MRYIPLILFFGLYAVQAAELLDRIVAVVNDDVITLTELQEEERFIQQRLAQQHIPAPPEDVLRRQVLEQLILKRLQLQLAKERGIEMDDRTLNQAIQRIAEQNGLTLEGFRQTLEREGYDFNRFRERLREEMILRKLRQKAVESHIQLDEKEVEAFLAKRMPQNEMYHLAHILIALPEGATPEQIQKAKEKAREVMEALKKGQDFRQVALAFSQGQQALQGGDLGWRKADELPTLFADIVPQMKVGEVRGPIRSPSGFHIIKLLEKRSETPGTAEADTSLRQKAARLLFQRKVEQATEAWLRKLRDQAYVEIRLEP